MRRIGALLGAALLGAGCDGGDRPEPAAELLDVPAFGALAPFEAIVVSKAPLPFHPSKAHSAALEPYTVTLKLDDGRRLKIEPIHRDANWPWVAESLVVGRRYRFPAALSKRPGSP